MNVEELLERYFEGKTSCEEERMLCRYFTEDEIPEHLQMYYSLFAYITQEAETVRTAAAKRKNTEMVIVGKHKNSLMRRSIYAFIGAAAGLFLLIGFWGLLQQHEMPQDYVIIDGKQYTDVNLIKEQALAAFHDVSTTEDEVFDLMFE